MNLLLFITLAFVVWAIVSMQRDRRPDGARTAELEARVRELAEALERTGVERERLAERLAERVQNLEAIVTTETYDLLRHDPEQAASRIELPDDVEDENPEEHAARLARRMRS